MHLGFSGFFNFVLGHPSWALAASSAVVLSSFPLGAVPCVEQPLVVRFFYRFIKGSPPCLTKKKRFTIGYPP